jgi:hypothetical protein
MEYVSAHLRRESPNGVGPGAPLKGSCLGTRGDDLRRSSYSSFHSHWNFFCDLNNDSSQYLGLLHEGTFAEMTLYFKHGP